MFGVHYLRLVGMCRLSKEESNMKMTEVRDKAKSVGIDPGKMKKTELIRAIQTAEGFNACFGTGTGDCPYVDCCFRFDCVEIKPGIGALKL